MSVYVLLTTMINSICVQGGEQVELIRGGTDIEVTASNVHEYVRKYADYRMIKVAEKALRVSIIQTVVNFICYIISYMDIFMRFKIL